MYGIYILCLAQTLLATDTKDQYLQFTGDIITKKYYK